MSKGIREFACAVFNAKIAKRNNKEYSSDTAFRKDVVISIAEQFDISIGAASSAYNYAKQQLTLTNPQLVEGLGRPEGKNNGGPKKKKAETTATVATTAETVQILDERGNVLSTFETARTESLIVLA